MISIGLFGEIGALAEILEKEDSDKIKEGSEERKALEQKLQEFYVMAFDKFPASISGLLTPRKFKQYISELRLDENAERGIAIGIPADHSSFTKYALKIKEKQGDLEPHEAHAVNVMDSKHFHNEKHRNNFVLARMLNPIRAVDPYVLLKDRFSSSDRRERSFVQIQEYIPGHNLIDVIMGLKSLPPNRKINEAVKNLISKCFKDIHYWHENALHLPERELDPKKIVQQYAKSIEEAIENAKKYTDCEINKNSFDIKAICGCFAELLPKKKSEYVRVLDSTPGNIVLMTDLERLSKENLDHVLETMNNERIAHVDPRERYGHRAEDFFNIIDSKVFDGFEINEENLSALKKNEELYSFLMNINKNDLIGARRALRLRDFFLVKYAGRLHATKETRKNYENDLKGCKKGIKHQDEKAIAHLDGVVKDLNAEGKTAESQALSQFQALNRQMSDFSQFKFE